MFRWYGNSEVSRRHFSGQTGMRQSLKLQTSGATARCRGWKESALVTKDGDEWIAFITPAEQTRMTLVNVSITDTQPKRFRRPSNLLIH